MRNIIRTLSCKFAKNFADIVIKIGHYIVRNCFMNLKKLI